MTDRDSWPMRLLTWVDDLLPSPKATESRWYRSAAAEVREFSEKRLGPLLKKDCAKDVSALIFEHAIRSYEDAEKDRDRAAQRADRVLVVVGLVAGFVFAGTEPAGWCIALGAVALTLAAVLACLARRATNIIGPAAIIGVMNTAADEDVGTTERFQCLVSMQLHRSVESIRWSNEWTNRMLSMATLLLIIAFAFLTAATLVR